MIRKVRDNQTGKIIEVDDNDLGSYGLQSPAAEIAPQKSLTDSVGEGAFNLLKSIAMPAVRTAKNIVGAGAQTPLALLEAGATANKNNQALPSFLQSILGGVATGAGQARNALNPIGLNEQELQGYSDNPQQKLVQQAKDTINLSSYAVPFGKGANFLTKAIAPGAATGALQAVSEDSTNKDNMMNRILGGAVTGGVLGGATEGVAKLAKRGLGLLGKGLTKQGENLATKVLRPAPKQVTEFESMAGEKFGQFLQKRGLVGASAEKILDHTQQWQSAFDDVVRSPDLKIKTNDLFKSFEKHAADFAESTLPEQQAKGDYLKKIVDNLKKKNLGEEAGADMISNLKTEAAKLVKDFKGDDATKGKLQVLSDIYRETVQGAADKAGMKINGMSAKEAGRELQKLYTLSEIAEKQSGLGKGSLPMGITALLGSGAGSIVGGPAGAIGGAMAVNAFNNPAVTAARSKGATAVGGALQGASSSPLLDKVLGGGAQIRGQVSSRLPGFLGSVIPQGANPQDQPNQYEAGQEMNQNTPPGGSIQQPQQPDQQQMIQQALIFDILQNKGKNVAQIKTLAGILSPGGSKPLSTAAAQQLSDLDTAKQYLTDLDKTIDDNKGNFGPIKGRLGAANPYDTNAQSLNAELQTVAQIIGKALEGGKLSDNDRKFYQQNLVTISDTPALAKAKIKRLTKKLEDQRSIRSKGFENIGYNSPDEIMSQLGAQ